MYLGCITLGSCSFVLELQWVSFSLSWWIRAWFLSLFTRPTPCWDPAASTGALFRTWWSNILSLCKGFINQNLYWPFHSLLIGTLERAAWVLACELATVISSKTKREFLQDKEQLTHWTIYSATTFLESCRKVVREKWFEKSGSRNLVREKWLTRKKGGFIL